ncbi:uncharacterized protein ACRADG_003911 [Cochliomyia hominivorax]
MKTNSQIFIILLVLIISNQAEEISPMQQMELKEEIVNDNTTVKQDVEEPVTENSLHLYQIEITQKVVTEADLKDNSTDLKSPDYANITGNQEVKNLENEKQVPIILSPNHQNMNETSTNSSESVEEETTTVVYIEKPSISLEEYALKQMNFILDYLLIEIQDFVAKVLQASINTVFQRDNLKRYAEGLNNILNPDSDVDYSDEILMQNKNLTQDEIYEEIVHKLNFLKSKPTRYLQRQLPSDWIRDYRNKKAELTIWLDKASEQMHYEFNRYVTQDEDPIKYQYFNEAFDDISRATEIHQKLALLTDLVKIVKNKKQITFMDLYMQT